MKFKLKDNLHQIHSVLPVKDVVEALKYYVNKLGFTIGFANDSKNPTMQEFVMTT